MSASPDLAPMGDLRKTPLRRIRACFYVFFPAGGIARYTHELAKAMASLPGVDVEVLASPDYLWNGNEHYPVWDGLRNISHRIPAVRRSRFLSRQFINPTRGIRYALEAGADVIHFSNINHLTFPLWGPALRRSGLKVVASVHDVRRQKTIIYRPWEDRQLRAFYQFADGLIVHSTSQAEELTAYAGVSPDKVRIVPHGPYSHGAVSGDRDAIRRELGLPSDRQVALFFGQVRDEKNLDGLIRALKLSSSRPHVLVAGTMGGRHRGLEFYEQLAREEGVENLITFMPGFIPDEQVGRLFVAADWIALPYHARFTSQSGVLNVAAHYERPVLVTPCPVLKETVQASNIGVISSGASALEISAAVDHLSTQVRDGFRFDFESYRRQFGWAENARRTHELYRQLVCV